MAKYLDRAPKPEHEGDVSTGSTTDRVEISLNLAFGSAMASIGLTIPAIAIASVWLTGPLMLGLGATKSCYWPSPRPSGS